MVPAVFSTEQVDAITAELQEALAGDATGSTLRTVDGAIYGARNLLHLWPGVADVWKQPLLLAVLKEVLVRPVLKDAGWTSFSSRTARRFSNARIDVVNWEICEHV